jgi:hypothetical protein
MENGSNWRARARRGTVGDTVIGRGMDSHPIGICRALALPV